jgi:N utilization substance protein A
MRGSRIQAIVRELNNEKIDIVNYSDQPEILVSRALSPAKPTQLFIDDEKKYCVALFNHEELEFAIGRNGMNINLASKITDYKIDAYGNKQYERIQQDQKTDLEEIPDVDKSHVVKLKSIGINLVSNLLDADIGFLLTADGIDEESLDLIYQSVQNFIERKIETEDKSVEEDKLTLDNTEKIENNVKN